MYVQIVGTALHVMWCYILVVRLEMGIVGTSIATCITYITMCVAITIYTYTQRDISEALIKPNGETFNNLGYYLKLGIPSMLMLSMESWTFELLTLFAGYISIDVAASQVILINVAMQLFMVPFGIQQAAATLVGNSIGENNVAKAKKNGKIVIVVAAGASGIIAIILTLFSRAITSIYTKEESIVALTANAMPLLALSHWLGAF